MHKTGHAEMRQFSIRELKNYWNEVSQISKAAKNAAKEGDLESGNFSIHLLIPAELPDWDDLCSDLDWQLRDISGRSYSEANFGFVGVYRLIAFANGTRADIPRFCGIDGSGTLYIGKASRLHARLNQLRRSYKKGKSESSHAATSFLRSMHNYPFPGGAIMIANLFTAAHTTSIVERDLLGAYRYRFGELPPLNVDTN